MHATGEEYRVRLDAFEGPLDLLLHLIRRAEVDITDIPIGQIADQFVAQLRDIESIDIELAGEFLLMASTLMEIKSRMIGPVTPTRSRSESGSDDGEDPRTELVRQLMEYKTYRDAAEALRERREAWLARVPAGQAGVDRAALRGAVDDEVDLSDVELMDLVEAFQRIYEAVNFDRIGQHEVTYDDTPIELHAEDLLDQLGRVEPGEGGRQSMRLVRVFEGRTRGEMIGLFLAVLEMVKQRRLEVVQDDSSGEIAIGLRVDGDAAAPSDGRSETGAGLGSGEFAEE